MFTRFGTMVDDRTHKTIEHGRRSAPSALNANGAPLTLGERLRCSPRRRRRARCDAGSIDLGAFRAAIPSWLAERCPDVVNLAEQAPPLDDQQRARLKTALEALAEQIAR